MLAFILNPRRLWMALLALALFPWSAMATTTLGSGSDWTHFRWFGSTGSFDALEGPFNFEVPSGSFGVLQITDAFDIGDTFSLSDGSTVYGTTSTPIPGIEFTRDPDVAFADDRWSSGEFEFAEGIFSVQVEAVTDTNQGGGYVRLQLHPLLEITWDDPGTITYGTPLDASHLDASVPLGSDGTLIYDPPLGTILGAGQNQMLGVTFDPNDPGEPEVTTSVTIDVLKAPLQIVADSHERAYGEVNPVLTAHFIGFVNNEGPADLDNGVSVSTLANTQSPPGSYTVEPHSATSSNYDITFVNGTITVTGGPQVPMIDWTTPEPITYGTPLSDSQLSATAASGASGTFAFTPPLGTVLGAGQHTLEVTFTPDDPNAYQSATQSVTLTVFPAPLTIQANAASRFVGDSNPPFTASYLGFVNGDGPESLQTSPSFATTANASSGPGEYPIVASGASAANYSFSYIDGLLTVLAPTGPRILWTPPAPITYGTPLTEAQLNATLSETVPGSFIYTPSADTLLNAGTHLLSVTFFTEDPSNGLNETTKTVTLTVEKAPLIIRADDKQGLPSGDQPVIVPIEFVLVGDPDNLPEIRRDPFGRDISYGSVAHAFEIGKHEITNEIYAQFLNAVAKDDPDLSARFTVQEPLYTIAMGDSTRGGIVQLGEAPNYRYETKPLMADKPVAFVSFLDVCRFCNWLHNGMPEGPRSAETTEAGAYDLRDEEAVLANGIIREPGARYFVPSQDEWYKAAFYDPEKSNGNPGYWRYATQSDTAPEPALADASGNVTNNTANVANFGRNADWDVTQDGVIDNIPTSFALGPEDGLYTTVGSAGPDSASHYGAFGMAGNASEWTEHALTDWARIIRGGNWNGPENFLASNYEFALSPSTEVQDVGFRVARMPLDMPIWDLPELTVSYEGFVNGDTADVLTMAPSPTTIATGNSLAGAYAIVVSGAMAANYDITYEEGTLTLAPAVPPTITPVDMGELIYGTPLSTDVLPVTASIDDVAVEGVFTYEPDLGTILAVGDHDIVATFTPTDLTQYTMASLTQSVSIQPAPLTIRVADAERAFDAPNPEFTFTFEGFVNDEDSTILDTPPTATTEATQESAPGTYPITASGAEAANYVITYENGSLTILEPILSELPKIQIRPFGDGQVQVFWNETAQVRLVRSTNLIDWELVSGEASTLQGVTVQTLPKTGNIYFYRLERIGG